MHATVDSRPHMSCHPQACLKYSIKRSSAERHCARLQRTFVSQTRVHEIKTMKGLKCAWFSPVSRFRPGFVLLKPCCLHVDGNKPRCSYALFQASPSAIGPPPLDTTHVGRTRRHCVYTYHRTGTATEVRAHAIAARVAIAAISRAGHRRAAWEPVSHCM